MSRLVFHPVSPDMLVAGDYPLVLLREQDGSWKVSAGGALPDDWRERNQELFKQRFRLLRDGRDYLRALLAMDPMPEVPCVPARAIKRQADGTYLIRTPSGQCARIRRSKAGKGRSWLADVYDKDAIVRLALPCRSLWEVRVTLSLWWAEQQ